MDEVKENPTVFDDLPDDCVSEILKKLKTRAHRNDARLVCKFWNDSINSDSSCERYLIDRSTTGEKNWTRPKFSDFIDQFLIFNRKKVSFRFQNVDLHNTEHFWTEKGAHIIGLNFEISCSQIPLEHIFSTCSRLREMYIAYSAKEIMVALKSFADNELYNYSLNFLTIVNMYNLESVIQLVGIISKVFPNMKKVKLHVTEDINEQFEELWKKLVHLKCELELKACRWASVFDPSSKTPISISKMCINNWTIMSPSEYYKNLEVIEYLNSSQTFQLSQLETIFSQCPMLRSLCINNGSLTSDLRNPIANQLTDLRFHIYNGEKFHISTVFVETFKFLKTLHLRNVSFAAFKNIILNLEHLEDLFVRNSIVVPEESEINNEQKMLVHKSLKKLTMPSYFSSHSCTYHFFNLEKLILAPTSFEGNAEMQYVDTVLGRFCCSNLKRMRFEAEMKTDQKRNSHLCEMLMSSHPKLETFSFRIDGKMITRYFNTRHRFCQCSWN